MLAACEAKTIGTTVNAHISIANFLPLVTVQPLLIKNEESHPPPILPTSAITYMIIRGGPILSKVMP